LKDTDRGSHKSIRSINKKTMNNKIKTSIVSIVIVGLLGVIGYRFSVDWVNDKLLLERNITILQVQNEIYKAIKTDGVITINAFEAGEDGEIQIIDNIILVESNAD